MVEEVARRLKEGSQTHADQSVSAPNADDAGTKQVFEVMSGFLGHLQSVIGEGASHALIRYGAFEEGKRIATTAGGNMDDARQAFDLLFRQETSISAESEDTYEVRVRGSGWVRENPSALDVFAVGLLEGLLQTVVRRRFKGELITRSLGGNAVMVFRLDPAGN